MLLQASEIELPLAINLIFLKKVVLSLCVHFGEMQYALLLLSLIQYTWIPTTVYLSGMFQKLRLKSPADLVAEALLIRISDYWHIKQWNRLNMKHRISQYVYFNYY